jgi:hypothetical protein
LNQRIARLEARVATLELRDQAESAPPTNDAPPVAAVSGLPSAVASAATRDDEPRVLSNDPKKRAERVEREAATITAYWKEWGTKHGLSTTQIDGLAALQVTALKRKSDNQSRMVDGDMTQPAARVDNRAAVDEVRRGAKALLTPEQFAEFEADKGAEWGSSYRKVREAHAKAAASAP